MSVTDELSVCFLLYSTDAVHTVGLTDGVDSPTHSYHKLNN